MPSVPSRFNGLGVGFAPYLIRPPEDVVRWTVGEPGFDTPRPVVDAAIASLERGETYYTRGPGSIELCTKISEQLNRLWNLTSTPESVMVTPGAKQALLYAMMVTMESGDEMLVPSPAWPTYEGQAALLGIKPVFTETDDNFHPDLENMRSLKNVHYIFVEKMINMFRNVCFTKGFSSYRYVYVDVIRK